MKKSNLLALILTFTISITQAQDEIEEFKIVSQLIYELEQRNWFPDDIYPLMPPPPESREYFHELRDDLTPNQADSLYTRIEIIYKKHLKRISERNVDSSFIYLATENYLSGAKCKLCGIKPDSLLKYPEYGRYSDLINQIVKGKKKDLKIPFDVINYKGKYKLKSINEFPSIEKIYDGNLNFLSGGEISISRFYQQGNLGVIYFSTSSCTMDCSAGYLVLYEKNSGEWKIFDILLQWIT